MKTFAELRDEMLLDALVDFSKKCEHIKHTLQEVCIDADCPCCDDTTKRQLIISDQINLTFDVTKIKNLQ